jgi:hypothetical protein
MIYKASFVLNTWTSDINLVSATLAAVVRYNSEVSVVSKPTTLAIFELGMLGLASRRFNK